MQTKDDQDNLRWYVYLADGRRKITWVPTLAAAQAKAKRYGLAAVEIKPAPPLGSAIMPATRTVGD